MPLRNNEKTYGYGAISLHWLMALLFFFMIGMGLTMTSLPLDHPRTFPLYQLHKSLGMVMLVLVCLRLFWRQMNEQPAAPALSALERGLMHLTHYGLYACLFLMPLTGWVVVSSSAFGLPTRIFDLITLPHIWFVAESPHKAQIHDMASEVHEILAWAALALIALHAFAAIYHHFVRRDDVLMRMILSRSGSDR